MIIQLTRSVKIGGEWKQPGSTIEVPDDDAKRLVVLKAATQIERSAEIHTDDELEESFNDLEGIDGVSAELARTLHEAGYKTIQQVAEAEPEDLIRLKGIGRKTVETIQDSAQELLEEEEEEE